MISILILGLTMITSASTSELTVRFEKLRNTEGTVKYLIFSGPEGFPDTPEKAIKQGVFEAIKVQEGLRLELAPGHYAISIIHDENNNDKLDTNFMGIPKEGFGFSNNPRIFFGPPSFEKASFEFSQSKEISIEMKYF